MPSAQTPFARTIDTGPRTARWNLAMTAAMAALHPQGEGAMTLRFQHFPPSVLLGRHQALRQAVRVEACRARGVEIARRATGGGAVYMDPAILAWDVVADRRRFGGRQETAAEEICAALCAGLATLGVAAAFAPPGAVIAEGRKLCGTSGLFDGATLLFQGTVLIDLDLPAMAAALVEAQADLAGRVVGLTELLGRRPSTEAVIAAITAGFVEIFGAAFEPSEPTSEEFALAERLLAEEFGSEAFVDGPGAAAVEAAAAEAAA